MSLPILQDVVSVPYSSPASQSGGEGSTPVVILLVVAAIVAIAVIALLARRARRSAP